MAEKKKGNKRGPKCRYDEKVKPKLDLIEGWRKEGYSEKWVADELNVGYSTLSEYKAKYPELAEALKASKARLVNNLKNALYKEAMGYEYDEVTEELELSPYEEEIDGKVVEKHKIEKIKRKKTKKKVRGNANLLIFAVCNLDPNWKRIDKEVIEDIKDALANYDEKVSYSNKIFEEAFNKLYPKRKKEN
ncbi:MAG: hypothetical protein ABF289_18415 [Clostridiales bacterium]